MGAAEMLSSTSLEVNQVVYVVEPPNPAAFQPIIFTQPQIEPGIYKAIVAPGGSPPLINLLISKTSSDLIQWENRTICTLRSKVFTLEVLHAILRENLWASDKEPADPTRIVDLMVSKPELNLSLAEILAKVALRRVTSQQLSLFNLRSK